MSNLNPQQFGAADDYWARMEGFHEGPLPAKRTYRPMRHPEPAPKVDNTPKQGIKPMQGPETHEAYKFRLQREAEYEMFGNDW